MKKKTVKGSFTIEGAVIVPFILFMSMGVLQLGISFYQESVESHYECELEQIDAVSTFYKFQMLNKLGKDIIENGT